MRLPEWMHAFVWRPGFMVILTAVGLTFAFGSHHLLMKYVLDASWHDAAALLCMIGGAIAALVVLVWLEHHLFGGPRLRFWTPTVIAIWVGIGLFSITVAAAIHRMDQPPPKGTGDPRLDALFEQSRQQEREEAARASQWTQEQWKKNNMLLPTSRP